MRLTIIAPESVYEHEVDPSMEIRDVKALVEAETGAPVENQTLSTDSGVALTSPEKSLASYGLNGESATLFLTFSDHRPFQPATPGASSTSDDDFERMRLQALGDPRLMNQLRQANPEFAAAIQSGGARFRDMVRHQADNMRRATEEKERQTELLNADPYDIEAQKKIEEAIRMEAVLENMSHAMEYSPESFGRVTMLYIDVEVNGHPVKAFVDSGAQSTIISPECAEACGIMRLIDKRFAGIAEGVGTAKILGRVHSAQMKLGNLFLPVAFSVLEGQSVDLLFGLDMLKRHQACIDLSANCLRIGEVSIPFLSEHELPEKARHRPMPEYETPGPSSSQPQASAGPSGSAPTTAGSSRAPGTTQSSADIQTLVSLGATPDQAAQLLEASGGDVDVAASMLFG
jgi:DNA damage-inducible protein 1